MTHIFQITTFLFLGILPYSHGTKLVCYYHMSSASKAGPAKFTSKDMELALFLCTHVIYSSVTITPKKYTITALSSEVEHELAGMQFFKKKYPNVKFLLSLSGDSNWETTQEYLNLLEADRHKTRIFIKSLMSVVAKYKFDGLSLDIPLPTEKPKNAPLTYYSKIWHNFINLFKSVKEEDSKNKEHKDQLTTLIRKLSTYLQERNGLLVLNVLPNVDSAKYFDIAEIIKNLDFVVLSAFDFYTPQRNPKEADLMAPIKPYGQDNNHRPLANIKNLYKYWHSRNVPRNKIVVGIAAFGRAWKLTKHTKRDGVPPVLYTDGPAAAGAHTQTPGFLSYPEICQKLSRDHEVTRVSDPKAKSGVYAFRPADSRGDFGIWISYEDPISAGAKTMYTRNHNLGGVALFDLSLDDVHGECSGEKFPILRSIKFRLTRSLS